MFPFRCAFHALSWVVLVAALPGCRPATPRAGVVAPDEPPPKPVRVVVSTPLVADLVEKVGGGGVEIDALLGVDEGLAKLERTGPVESRLISAELIVLLGFGQEAMLAPSVARAAEAGAVICELQTGIPRDALFFGPADPAQADPHIWLDPMVWLEATRPVEDALIALRPSWAADLRKRGHAVRFELAETARLMARLAGTALAPNSGPLRTARPALRYLTRPTGLPLELITDPAGLANSDELESLPLDLLRAPGIKAVASIKDHDLGTVDGLRAYALDLLLLRNQ